jgi:hypothetical protein
MLRSALVFWGFALTSLSAGLAQAVVRVSPPDVNGTRTLQEQTGTAAIRDYLESWQTLKTALQENRVDVLDRDFVGTGKEKLIETIQEQRAAEIRTSYQDRSHDIQIVFYSPEGLSLELTDNVEYDVRVLVHDKPVATQKVRARYIVVMTPAETRWRVRVYQAVNE